MDDLVLRGMAKWPDVPAVYGWLELDARGNWLIKGDRIANPAIVEFIGRNYAHDDHGRWFFQNGPQRVFVRPHYTPIVYRTVNAGGEPLAVRTHTGKPVVRIDTAWFDENAALLIGTGHGGGVLHDRDLELVLGALCHSNGAPVTEEELEALMCNVQQVDDAHIAIRYANELVAIRFLPSHRVAQQFDFCQLPAPLPENGNIA